MSISQDVLFHGCDLSRFDAFTMKDVTYKQIDGHKIEATILTPKKLGPGNYPVIIRWHGGGLVNGHRLFAQWIAPFILTHALQANAILVLPDYRLLPGVGTAREILKDVKDFFDWLYDHNLKPYLDDGINADLSDVLISGESAGGWVALQSAFITRDRGVRAIIAQYPMIDMRDGHWTSAVPNKYLQGSPLIDLTSLDRYFESEEEKVVTNRIPPCGGELYIGLVQHGRYGEMFGKDSSLYPLEVLDRIPMPPLWLVHGSEDSIVPIAGSIKFANKLQREYSTPFLFTTRPGEEHLFDVNVDADQEWVRDGLRFIGKYWTSQGRDKVE